MSQNKVNMSLDEIIKENTSKNTRGRGSFRNRGARRGRGGGGRERNSRSRSRSRNRLAVRGGGVASRGRGAARGRGARGRGAVGRLSRRDTSGFGGSPAQNRSRSASRNRGGGNNVQRSRSRSRNRNQQGTNNTTSRGRSQSRNRGAQNSNAKRQRSRSRSRGRINTIQNIRGGRGRGRGISKIGRNRLLATGISTEALRAKKFNSISQVGLRSDQIIQAQKMKRVQNKVNNARNLNNVIRSQTFTRSKTLPATSATSLTVSVANEFAAKRKLNRKRKNSATNQVGYLDRASLEKLTQLLGGNTVISKGPGSVRSMGSNRSKRSNRSMRSNTSRGRGRGKKNFSMQKALNPRLQQQIAQIQGKTFSNGASEFQSASAGQPGINFTPTPHLTTTSLSDRFGKM